jgi:uracil phosphoribosyltransferase
MTTIDESLRLSRNKDTERDEFIFYSKRLMRVLIEYALSLLPFEVSIEYENEVSIVDLGRYHSNDR